MAGVMKKRAPFTEVVIAARGSALPLVIPVIIMGGILSGWFTPTEAGMIAAVYIRGTDPGPKSRAHPSNCRGISCIKLLYSFPSVPRRSRGRVGVRLDGRITRTVA